MRKMFFGMCLLFFACSVGNTARIVPWQQIANEHPGYDRNYGALIDCGWSGFKFACKHVRDLDVAAHLQAATDSGLDDKSAIKHVAKHMICGGKWEHLRYGNRRDSKYYCNDRDISHVAALIDTYFMPYRVIPDDL